MTCHVARLPQDHPPLDLFYCWECGSTGVEVFYASRIIVRQGPRAAEELQEKSMKKSPKGISAESAQSKKDMKKKPE